MFNRNYRGEPQQRTFGAVRGYLDFTSLLTSLGSIVELRLGMMQHYLMLPLPSEVIFALEEERLRLLGFIRTTLGNTTQYMQYFSVKPVAGLPVLKTMQISNSPHS